MIDPEPAVEPASIPDDEGDARGEVVPVQQAFPALWQHVRPSGVEQFAHPAERDFASILSYYRVRWGYEPTSFPIEWAENGRPTELFTPDFYLPDLRLYVELTTMRQRLVTRKNKKLRRLRELYPDIRIKLLYRRDYHQFVDLYLHSNEGSAHSTPGRVLVTGAEIEARIETLAAEIARSEVIALDEEPLLVMVSAPGADRFAALLGDALSACGVRLEWDSVRLTRAGRTGSAAQVRLRQRPAIDPRGRLVLLLTDVVNTGMSLSYLSRWLRRKGARNVVICAMFDRAGARLVDVPLRFRAFEAPNELLAGFGLSLRPEYAELDAVHTLVHQVNDPNDAGENST